MCDVAVIVAVVVDSAFALQIIAHFDACRMQPMMMGCKMQLYSIEFGRPKAVSEQAEFKLRKMHNLL